jgi:hypothetical protein
MFLSTITTGDLLKLLQGVPLMILGVGVSVSSKALHLPELSELPSLPHEASRNALMMMNNLSMVISFWLH